jgi:hypothetical protein
MFIVSSLFPPTSALLGSAKSDFPQQIGTF